MKKSFVLTLALFSLLHFVTYGQSTYSWEDGGTILGYYGNLADPQFPEALFIHYMYALDSQMDIMQNTIDSDPNLE